MKIRIPRSKILTKKNLPYFLVLGVLAIIIQIEVVILFSFKNPQTIAAQSLETYAEKILDSCKGAPHRPTCYDKTIPKLMDTLSMEEAFKVTKLVQDQDDSYMYCHVLGHELSAREVQKDPANWKDIISRCPSGQCSNGCIHGGFQERFRKESFTTDAEITAIKPDLMEICEARSNWNPTGLEQASCYHALGHLTMYITNADLNKATALCGEVANKNDGRDFRQLCYDGAFMQIFQPLEPEDFALVKGKQPTKKNVKAFCASFPEAEHGSCISESWPLFRDEIQQPEGFIAHCSSLPSTQQDRCYRVLIYIVTPLLNFQQEAIGDYCSNLPQQLQPVCYANAASRMIETDYRFLTRAVALCTNAPTASLQDACFRELLTYSTYNYHPGSKESQEVCQALPAPWSEKCIQGTSQVSQY